MSDGEKKRMPIIGAEIEIEDHYPLDEKILDKVLLQLQQSPEQQSPEAWILEFLLSGTSDPEVFLPLVLDRKIDRLESEYINGNHPEAPWLAMLICDNYNIPVPEWVREHFAKIALTMFLDYRTDEDIAKDKNFGNHWVKALGGLDGDKMRIIRSGVRGDIVAAKVFRMGGTQSRWIEVHGEAIQFLEDALANPKVTIDRLNAEIEKHRTLHENHQTIKAEKDLKKLVLKLNAIMKLNDHLQNGVTIDFLKEELQQLKQSLPRKSAVSKYCRNYENQFSEKD